VRVEAIEKMFFTDWEGPWVLTDFALELSRAILNNERFFMNLSDYDDYLAYKLGRGGYEAGYTLKLLVPFLASANLKNDEVAKLAELTVKFVPEAKLAMERLQKRWEAVVISTSYMHFLHKTASMLGVRGKLHGTEVDFNSIQLSKSLREELRRLVDEIASLSGEDLYRRLDEIFSRKEVVEILNSVRAVGAGEKAEILRHYCESELVEFPIAVGDSISDYKMFEAARKLGGVAIAFNGNGYALRHADVAIVSSTAISEAAVVELFMEKQFNAFRDLQTLKIPETEIYIMEESDFAQVLERSERMRQRLRGLAGRLG